MPRHRPAKHVAPPKYFSLTRGGGIRAQDRAQRQARKVHTDRHVTRSSEETITQQAAKRVALSKDRQGLAKLLDQQFGKRKALHKQLLREAEELYQDAFSVKPKQPPEAHAVHGHERSRRPSVYLDYAQLQKHGHAENKWHAPKLRTSSAGVHDAAPGNGSAHHLQSGSNEKHMESHGLAGAQSLRQDLEDALQKIMVEATKAPGTMVNLESWTSDLDRAADMWAMSKSSSVHVPPSASRSALRDTAQPRDLIRRWREQRQRNKAPQYQEDDLDEKLVNVVHTLSLMDNDPCPPIEPGLP